MSSLTRGLAAVLTLSALTAPGLAQREFVNFETPQVKPITVATLDGRDWLLVCNTPDNSVEIYNASSPYTFVARVPVGLGPVTVRWHAGRKAFYTCNFDGDSVTKVALFSGIGGMPDYRVEATTFVGDEPSDIYFTGPTEDGTYANEPFASGIPGDDEVAWITLNSASGVARHLASDLTALTPSFFSLRNDPATTNGIARALREPRVSTALGDGRILIANLRSDDPLPDSFPFLPTGSSGPPFGPGGPVADPRDYDFDMMMFDYGSGSIAEVNGLGTTHHSFAIEPNGERMFVVGTRAQNQDAAGEPAVAAQPTGFVQSWLWVVDLPSAGVPLTSGILPRPEAAVGVPAPLYRSIDLNRDYNIAPRTPLDPDLAVAQPTDILVHELGAQSDASFKLYIAMYHSDRVISLTPDRGVAGGWRINRIVPRGPRTGYSLVGPRGLAQSDTASDEETGVIGLVYSANRLDNSVTVIDPGTDTVITQFALQNDPTPSEIRVGRQFLYSARLSGNNIVSCASCHVDARTDGLAWDLGTDEPIPIPPEIGEVADAEPSKFRVQKGLMVTQTLQGLVNFRVDQAQDWFTNAPYHWRGDQPTFQDFQPAFVNLQGLPGGITDAEMDAYTLFIETVAHPPNPEQALDRRQTGALGDEDPNARADASGSALGMLLYHNVPSVGGQISCVHCHILPEGSGNTLTDFFDDLHLDATLPTQNHGFETAALRNIVQRERNLPPLPANLGSVTPVTPALGNFGLLHNGDPTFFGGFIGTRLDTFLANFVDFTATPPAPFGSNDLQALVDFTRHFDWGVAPLAGLAYTLNGTPFDTTVFDLFEDQVEVGNIGLAVHVRDDSTSPPTENGYWYDISSAGGFLYREVGTNNLQPRSFFAGITGTVVLQATPAGSERRVASPSGQAPSYAGQPVPTPSAPTLVPMTPPTQWEDVTELDQNVLGPSNLSASRMLSFRTAIINNIPTGQPDLHGVPSTPRHEPPRRFAVASQDLQPGAQIEIRSALYPTGAPIFRLEVYPTDTFTADGQVWESAAELAPLETFAFLCGGPNAPGVATTLNDITTAGLVNAFGLLDPVGENSYQVRARNRGATIGTWGPWSPWSDPAPLEIAD